MTLDYGPLQNPITGPLTGKLTVPPGISGILANIDFVEGGLFTGTGALTIGTPVSTRYHMNSAGILTARGNTDFSPAYTNAGALLLGLPREPNRTNLSVNSSLFTPNVGLSVANTSIVGPDGNTYVNRLELVEGTITDILRTSDTVSFTAGTTYTASLFCKRGVGSRYPGIRLNSAAFGAFYSVVFNPDTEVATGVNGATVYGFEKYANGWYRVWITATATVTTSTTVVYAVSSVNTFIDSHLGDGTSSMYFFGKQVEAGVLTSYIPTEGSTVTRASEHTTAYTYLQMSGNFDQAQGTVIVKMALGWNRVDVPSMTARAVFGLANSSQGPIYLDSTGSLSATDGTTFPTYAGNYTKHQIVTVATKWSPAGLAIGHNIAGSFAFGPTPAYDGAFPVDGNNKIYLFGSGALPGPAYIQDVLIFNRVLTTTEIERLAA